MAITSVGQSLPRIDARGKVTGETRYSGDLAMVGMLSMKILFAERPHARVKSIKTSKAEGANGVMAVYTARDVPTNEYGLQIPDQPVLCGPGASKPYTDIVRFIGDQVAVVVAQTEAQAEAAIKLIEVEYEDLPVLADPITAMRSDAPILHPDRGDSNICVHYKIRKGDVDEAFETAHVIVESEYHTPVQEHAYLQPEAGLSYIDKEGRITIESAGQWTHADRTTIAHALSLPEELIRVIYPAIGGAFCGADEPSLQNLVLPAECEKHNPLRNLSCRTA